MSAYDEICEKAAKDAEDALEASLKADIIYFNAPIGDAVFPYYRETIEKLISRRDKKEAIAFFLTTAGGSAEVAEKIVECAHMHYQEVYFVIPDNAMSAGTIMCMAGDKIYMDYSSSLGPIDPQVPDKEGKRYVSALGYLDKVNEFILKSKNGNLSPLEYDWAMREDIGLLRFYEQARELSITLLKKWLVKYKFKNWTVHRSDTEKKGQLVTDEEKRARAEEIGNKLSDNKIWHSHARRINFETLEKECRLEIDDFGKDKKLQKQIRLYSDIMMHNGILSQQGFLIHSYKAQQRGDTQ